MRTTGDFSPALMLEVELSRPLPGVSPKSIETGRIYQRAISLVQLHTQPLGLVELRLDENGLSAASFARGIWRSLRLPITKHLQQEGLPQVSELFEILGNETNTVHLTNHWHGTSRVRKANEEYTGPDFAQDFHAFAVEWTPAELIWYVDGVEPHRSREGVLTEPMYLLANLAVGGKWPGAPDALTHFPSYFEVDYIRAYQFTQAR